VQLERIGSQLANRNWNSYTYSQVGFQYTVDLPTDMVANQNFKNRSAIGIISWKTTLSSDLLCDFEILITGCFLQKVLTTGKVAII
jgi:hypothetical protein